LVKLGGIEHAAELAQKYVRKAISDLEPLPETEYKQLLLQWANYMVNREF
jgi:geranylgeranyl diphosphate synthase type I